MSDPVGPDTSEMLRLWLRSIGPLVPLVGTRIGLGLGSTEPSIRYYELGDQPVTTGSPVVARYGIECWGRSNAPDDGTTGNVARLVRAAAPDFVGVWGGGRSAGATATRLFRQNDPTTGRPRHIVELAFVAHP